MYKTYDFFQLFDQFIAESKSGKRLKQDGSKITKGTINMYECVRGEINRFSNKETFSLRIKNIALSHTRSLKSEASFWKRFYRKYSNYLYSLDCYDNYVGAHFKVIRTFFNYLKQDKHIFSGDFHKKFHVRTENIPITVISPEQLKFLIHDLEFEDILAPHLKRTKDIFIFGCTVGLRFSDLMKLTSFNVEKMGDISYLKVRSGKTSTYTKILLPDYAKAILAKYKKRKTLLPALSNNQLNNNVKKLCEKAGWTWQVGKVREKRGAVKKINKGGEVYRFCDLTSTHTMRRTAITTLLSFGMPEIMVRKISGHGPNSKEFYRYVNYAQHNIDSEVNRIFSSLKKRRKHTFESCRIMLKVYFFAYI